jgi:hypothetical protein
MSVLLPFLIANFPGSMLNGSHHARAVSDRRPS